MKRARLLDKMPTVMEMADAVIDSSWWLQVVLQRICELPLDDMVVMKSEGEGKQWMTCVIHLFQHQLKVKDASIFQQEPTP